MSPLKKRTLFQLSFLLIGLLIVEIVLRFMGYAPGDLRPNWLWFKPVDSLYVTNNYYVNDKGLMVANKEYWAGQNIFINSDGFRSAEFSQLDSRRKKILFIGDSFTWGIGAKPLQDSSFCDLLAKDTSLQIINLGIPAADPAQYALLAETYIPRLKPDVVFVMFFMGNDLMKEKREIDPAHPFYYWTNAGAICADMDGKHYPDALSAYNYLVNEKYFLKNPKGICEKIISHSSLLSRLYSGKFRVQEKMDYERLKLNTGITKGYLNRIVSAAIGYDTKHINFVIIPEAKEADLSLAKYNSRYADLLVNASLGPFWLKPETSKALFRENPDGHLNNEGQRRYADFLKATLDNYFKEQ